MKEGNDKTRNKNKEKPLPNELASFKSIIVSTIDDIRNIKCKRPDIDARYWHVSKNVATNVDRDFIEISIVDLVNKNIIFNKPTAQGLGSYFIVNAKENSEVTDSTIGNFPYFVISRSFTKFNSKELTPYSTLDFIFNKCSNLKGIILMLRNGFWCDYCLFAVSFF